MTLPVDMKPVRQINVLVTGMGPFKKYTPNPSSNVAMKLDGEIITHPPKPLQGDLVEEGVLPEYSVRITYISLPTSYHSVSRLLPPLHISHTFDAFLHLGLAAGEDKVRLERRGRRLGYKGTLDNDGQLPPDVEGGKGLKHVHGWGDEAEWWDTCNIPECVQILQEKNGVKAVRESTDAGLYLCEYTLATTLSSALHSSRASRSSTPTHPPAPAFFTHIPLPTDYVPTSPEEMEAPGPYTEDELAQITRQIVWWMAGKVIQQDNELSGPVLNPAKKATDFQEMPAWTTKAKSRTAKWLPVILMFVGTLMGAGTTWMLAAL